MIEDPDLGPLIKGVDGSMDSVFGMPVDLTERLINEVLAKCDDFYADADAKDFDPGMATPTRYNHRERRSSEDADSKDTGSDNGRFSMGSKSTSQDLDGELMFGAPN
jgi:hypothetical protein